MQYLLALIFPLFSYILQTYPRLFNKYFGVDVWTRLIEIDHVKRAGHRIPGKIKKGFIIEGEFDYPIIFPWIFSFFPKKFLLNIQGFVSPFFDFLQNILVFFIAFSLTNNILISILAQAMYSVITIIPIENSYLTPRSMGYFVFTLAFYPIFLYHSSHNPILLLLSLFFTCVLFLTHRFALQAFIIISVFFTFIDRSPFYISNIILSFMLVTILTKGFYIKVAKGHLYNIYFWIKNYKLRFAHQIYGLKQNKKSDWVSKIYPLFAVFSPLFMFAVNIWAFSAVVYLFLYFTKPVGFPSEIIYFRMALWIISFYLFGAIVLKVKRLIPIGEGHRYMEMTTVPSVILSSILFFYFLKQYGVIFIVLLAVLMIGNLFVILLFQIKGIIADKNRSLTPDLEKVYKYINSIKGTPRIICIPHQITTMTVYNTKADVLVNADNKGLMKIMDFVPLLLKPISRIAKEFNLNYLLLRESFAKLEDLKIKNAKIIYRSGDIILVEL